MRTPVEIFDNRRGESVQAELFDGVTVDHFLETQAVWRPMVVRVAQQQARQGVRQLVPQHFHWDWTSKAPQLGVLAFAFYGIRYEGQLQGLMKLETVGGQCRCRLPEQEGKELLYVDYVEVAPWNLKPLAQALGHSPHFGGVGTRLVEAAVRRSVEEDCQGRIGLHALPLSEPFYSRACGMIPVGRDPAKQNLLWFEFTPEQAKRFLIRGAP